MQIYMKSETGEIEVFLCSEEDTMSSPSSSSETDTESEASPIKIKREDSQPTPVQAPSPPPRLDLEEESRSSDLGQIRNALISASEDFGPMGNQLQLQTLDQDQGKHDN